VDVIDPARFESEAIAFLEANAKPLPSAEITWGEGSDAIGQREDQSPDSERAMLRDARAWRAIEYDSGFGWLAGPKEYGGRELPIEFERRYREIRSRYCVGSHRPFVISLGMVAPTIVAHGTELVREAYVRELYRGALIGCQLFSEPGAGSDLASVSMRAVRDGDEWVVNGQKVWTSGAQHADIGEVLCRTDPHLPKHQGLSAFIVDMKAPGVEIRPLRTMTGGAPFNEVFFNDVRIADSHRLGEVNGGWRVAITTLMGERALGATPGVFGIEHAMGMLLELVKHSALGDDPVVREAVMRAYVDVKTVEYNGLRTDAKRRAGIEPGPEASIFKLSNTEAARAIAAAAGQVLGARLIADTGEWGTYSWSKFILGLPGMRIAAGTDEIMRNILGERVLGLPKDPQS
jgi:alkylation response protein AidB-like acyl-CoA dehydrogenase